MVNYKTKPCKGNCKTTSPHSHHLTLGTKIAMRWESNGLRFWKWLGW